MACFNFLNYPNDPGVIWGSGTVIQLRGSTQDIYMMWIAFVSPPFCGTSDPITVSVVNYRTGEETQIYSGPFPTWVPPTPQVFTFSLTPWDTTGFSIDKYSFKVGYLLTDGTPQTTYFTGRFIQLYDGDVSDSMSSDDVLEFETGRGTLHNSVSKFSVGEESEGGSFGLTFETPEGGAIYKAGVNIDVNWLVRNLPDATAYKFLYYGVGDIPAPGETPTVTYISAVSGIAYLWDTDFNDTPSSPEMFLMMNVTQEINGSWYSFQYYSEHFTIRKEREFELDSDAMSSDDVLEFEYKVGIRKNATSSFSFTEAVLHAIRYIARITVNIVETPSIGLQDQTNHHKSNRTEETIPEDVSTEDWFYKVATFFNHFYKPVSDKPAIVDFQFIYLSYHHHKDAIGSVGISEIALHDYRSSHLTKEVPDSEVSVADDVGFIFDDVQHLLFDIEEVKVGLGDDQSYHRSEHTEESISEDMSGDDTIAFDFNAFQHLVFNLTDKPGMGFGFYQRKSDRIEHNITEYVVLNDDDFSKYLSLHHEESASDGVGLGDPILPVVGYVNHFLKSAFDPIYLEDPPIDKKAK